MKRKILSILLSLAVAFTMMPAMSGISFAGEANTTVPVELVKATTSGSKAVKLSWTKTSGATKYVVYGQKCGKSYKKITTTSKSSYKVKKIKGKKLKAHKTYKFYVVAYNGGKKLATSKSIHFITGKTQGKNANAKSISVKPTSLTLEPGKTAMLKVATKIYKNKKHIKKSHGAATRYVSNNPAVASVNSKGVVTANKEGTAIIYVQDIGGLWCKTTVTVESQAPATTYTVSFDLNGATGTAPTAQTIKRDGKVAKPNDPEYTDHTFAGWYKTKDTNTGELSDPWNFDNDTVTADMTLYAQWTRTLESIYTNSDIPKVTDNTPPDNAWVNGEGGKAFIAYSTGNSVLYLNGTKTLSCRKTENFTKIGDDYVLDYYFSSSFYGKYTLHMTDGKFTSVTYNGAGTDYEELSGTYAATKTVADILPNDFPTFSWPLPDNVWKNSVGSNMYINNNGLTFGGVNLYNILSNPVTKDGNNYQYISYPYTITFVMDSGKLVKVKIEGAESADNNGDYAPPLATMTMKTGDTVSDWNKITITIKGTNIVSGKYYFDTKIDVDKAGNLENLVEKSGTELTNEEIEPVNSARGLCIMKEDLAAEKEYKIVLVVTNSAGYSQTIVATAGVGMAPPM